MIGCSPFCTKNFLAKGGFFIKKFHKVWDAGLLVSQNHRASFFLQNKADYNMNERNTEQHIRYLEEVCACLHRAGFETQPLEESQLLSIMYTQVTGRITPTGAIGTIRSSS